MFGIHPCTAGSTEVRANATAKATVAAFAASEGHAHPRVVELVRVEIANISTFAKMPDCASKCRVIKALRLIDSTRFQPLLEMP